MTSLEKIAYLTVHKTKLSVEELAGQLKEGAGARASSPLHF